MIALPLQRIRGRGELIDDDTQVVIEAFPRCASSFAVAAFRLAQEPNPTHIAHHTHMPAQVMEGVRAGSRRWCSCGPRSTRSSPT